MIAGVDNGVMIIDSHGGMEDPHGWTIQANGYLGKEIKDGKFTGNIFRNIKIDGYVPDILGSVDAVSHESSIRQGGCGKFIYKKFNYYNKEYQDILKEASQTKSKILLHIYPYNKTSFPSELSNELLYKHPNKLILAGRDRNGEIKFSVRGKDIKVLPIVKKVLETLEGRGGGHEYACGLQIKSVDLDKLLKIINEELEN